MEQRRTLVSRIAVCIGLAVAGFSLQYCGGQPAKTAALPTEADFFSLSDLHLDPYFDAALVPTLAAAEYTEWDSIFAASGSPGYGVYGTDSKDALFRSFLSRLKDVDADPGFITISGDFMAHHFEGEYFKDIHKNDTTALQSFILKTMKYMATSLKQTFPNTVIFPVLGNNDSFCGDYMVRPNGDFLGHLTEIWKPLVGGSVDVTDFENTFAKGGYYSATSPLNPDHKIIGLNSIMFSIKFQDPNYSNFCSGGDVPVADQQAAIDDQFAWLEQELEAARQNGQKVWLMYHIPPGVNGFSTARNTSVGCNQRAKTFWKEPHSQRFLALVRTYADVIPAQLAGHTHMDNFMVAMDGSKPVSYIHLTPALSPIFGNNPGFHHVTFNPGTGVFKDFEAHYFDSIGNTTNPQWKVEYRFSDVYGQPEITPEAMQKVFGELNANAALQKEYIDYYVVSHLSASSIDSTNWKTFWCSLEYDGEESFTDCLCGE